MLLKRAMPADFGLLSYFR